MLEKRSAGVEVVSGLVTASNETVVEKLELELDSISVASIGCSSCSASSGMDAGD